MPKTGIETLDQRKLLHDITGRWFDVPNIEIDHGIPTFALCGEVGLTAGPTVLGAAAIRLDAGLGLATYDDRPAVFRAFGDVKLVEIPLAQAALELHTNGYTRMHARFDWGIDGLATLKGGLQFEMLAPKFNATAHVDACLEFVDWCAGAKALVSVQGRRGLPEDRRDLRRLAARASATAGASRSRRCTSPAVTSARTRSTSAPGIENHVTAVPAQVRRRARDRLPGRAARAPRSWPRGQGAPPKLTLIGPNGERDHVTRRPAPRRAGAVPGAQGPARAPDAVRDRQAERGPLARAGRAGVGSAGLAEVGPGPGEAGDRGEGHRPRPQPHARTTRPTSASRSSSAARARANGSATGDGTRARSPSTRRRARPSGARSSRSSRAAASTRSRATRAPAAGRPGRTRGLKVTHRGTRVRISWKDAGAHEATIRLGDGRRLIRHTRKRSLDVSGVTRATTGTVSVRAVRDSGVSGAPARARVGRGS